MQRGALANDEGRLMDFIERWLHVYPDGGSGAVEIVYFLIAVAGGAGLLFRRRLRHLWEVAHSNKKSIGG
jgi:hypothetical protein